MKVSFIIPIYKVEQYLVECVSSITEQSYRDIEVILVNDGSPDNSPVLCDKLAEDDDRIVVIHKVNGGLSDARNIGLQRATGDYVVFVDGDDFWRGKNDLEKIMDEVKLHSNCDFIGYNCAYYYPDSNTFKPWIRYNDILAKDTNKNTALMELVKSGTFPMSACLKIIKREFLLNNELFFVKGQLAEDIPWFINLLDKSDNCCFVNLYIYAYRQNVTGSITNTGGEKSFNNLFHIFKTELEKIEKRSFNEEAKAAIKSFLAYEYSILLTYKCINKESYKELLGYKDILKYTMNPKVKMVSRINRLLGIRITRKVLMAYQSYRLSKK